MNSECDFFTSHQFDLWMYLVQDGQVPDKDPKKVDFFDKEFYPSGIRYDKPRSIPIFAHRKWLDLFTSTSV